MSTRLRRFGGHLARFGREWLRELRRLNNVGIAAAGGRAAPSRGAARRVKALIARTYRDANRCC